MLTSTHLTFIRVCMSCRAYNEAVPILDNIIHSFPTKKPADIDAPYPCSNHATSIGFITKDSGFTELLEVSHVLEYFLLGGMTYIALQKWPEAQLMLEHVLVAPSHGTASGMMLEAYQKWVMVSCLALGHVGLSSTHSLPEEANHKITDWQDTKTGQQRCFERHA